MTRFAAVPVLIALVALAGPASGAAQDAASQREALRRRLEREIDGEFARLRRGVRRIVAEALPQPFLGVQVVDPTQSGGEAPLRVKSVTSGSPAEAAGLRVGDRVLELAGKRPTTLAELQDVLGSFKPGDRVSIRVQRGDVEIPLEVVLGVHPYEPDEDDETPAPPPLAARRIDFEGAAPGVPMPGFLVATSAPGEPARFVVSKSEGAPSGSQVLRQDSTDPAIDRCPIAVLEDSNCADFHASVKFRLVSGERDRVAGLVFRYQDENNYLVARVSAVEGSVRIYRMIDGIRRTIPGARNVADLGREGWHQLEVEMRGLGVRVWLDGTLVLETGDSSWAAGRLGVWTKADAITEFDDFEVRAPK